MVHLRHTRLTYITANKRAKASQDDAQLAAEIVACLHCKYSACKYGYCDVVGTPYERKEFINSNYYKKQIKKTALTDAAQANHRTKITGC